MADKTYTSCVSLGPGDAELITLKALRTLERAKHIFCPQTIMGSRTTSRAYDILSLAGIDTSKVELFTVQMTNDRSQAERIYLDVAQKMAGLHRNRIHSAVVAEGDSGFYSSVHYVSEHLQSMGICVNQVAGVPAFIACGALAGLHIVKQHEPLLVFPSDATAQTIANEVNNGKTVVLMKLSRQEVEIKNSMEMLPYSQFHYFENVGVEQKQYYTSLRNEIQQRTFPYFSIIIIKNK